MGSTTMRAVLSAALRRAAKDLLRLRDPALRPVLACVRAQLKFEPGRVMAILRRPNVGAAVRVLREGPQPRLAGQLAATLALELHFAGATLPALSFSGLPARVACLGGGFAVPGGAKARLVEGRWSAGGVTVALGDPSDRPYHAVAPGLVLATLDDNPLAMDEAHPDKSGNAVDLGGQGPDVWVTALKDALQRIERYLPAIREEASLTLSQFVPVGYDERKHLSASYAEALGTIYLSLHPDPMTMTEAVIHELSHNKLNALMESGGLLENAFHPLFTSPVRPDPRPLHGVLLAVHAFLPVEALYRAMAEADDPISRRPGFSRRRAVVTEKNREGASVLLEHAEPTALGRGLLDEIRRLVADPESAT
ncbi:MAG: HEXXH motif-containing putative peptide modification protein [Sandaracinaceae bacterium]